MSSSTDLTHLHPTLQENCIPLSELSPETLQKLFPDFAPVWRDVMRQVQHTSEKEVISEADKTAS